MEPPERRNLAHWLLAQEAGKIAGPQAVTEAAEAACQRLCRRLAQLVAVAGARALLARALRLAAADFPFLETVRAGATDETCLEGLRERARDVDPGQARDGLAAVLAAAIGLMATFIGDDLTLRLLRDVWPDLPSGETDEDLREAAT
jgi:hypothetical protein